MGVILTTETNPGMILQVPKNERQTFTWKCCYLFQGISFFQGAIYRFYVSFRGCIKITVRQFWDDWNSPLKKNRLWGIPIILIVSWLPGFSEIYLGFTPLPRMLAPGERRFIV